MSGQPKSLKQILFAKAISPDTFENKTPLVHKVTLDFLNAPGKRKVVEAFRDFGKTTLLNNIFILSRIFFEAEPYTWIVSENDRKAKSFLRKIKRLVLKMQALGWDVKQGEIWNENECEIIANGKVCGIAAFGAGEDPRGYTSKELGKGPTLVLIDDILSRKKARSANQRNELKDYFWSDIEPAVHPEALIIVIGTPLHKEDLLNDLMTTNGWQHIIIPIMINGKSAWPDRKSMEWIERKKDILRKKGMMKTWYNEYLCVAQGDETQLFKPEMINYFKEVKYADEVEEVSLANAKENIMLWAKKPLAIVFKDGREIPIAQTVRYATMDLATEGGADNTSIITCAYDSDMNMYVVGIDAAHWNPFRRSLHVVKNYKTWTPIQFGIERAGAQNDFFYNVDLIQKELDVYIPVKELSHRGVSKNIRIANLHPLFAAGKVWLNESDPMTTMLEAELFAFQEDIESNRDDLIDALAYQLFFIKDRVFKRSKKPRPKRKRLYGG